MPQTQLDPVSFVKLSKTHDVAEVLLTLKEVLNQVQQDFCAKIIVVSSRDLRISGLQADNKDLRNRLIKFET